jgi:hypothetical protein
MRRVLFSIAVLGLLGRYLRSWPDKLRIRCRLQRLNSRAAFSFSDQGTESLCFTPGFTATEACSTPKAVTAQLNQVAVGQFFDDGKGNTCGTFTTFASFLGGSTVPLPSTNVSVSKITGYNPSTGVGDASFTDFLGGTCVGAVYVPPMKSVVHGTGTFHFVVSSSGSRLDLIFTSLTNPQNDIGSFARLGVAQRQ